ncbi:MAG: pdtaS5 [Deltaproteobacteria bacterium]|nr:pdtaS5 [Deltaproteobacteria bacterium]
MKDTTKTKAQLIDELKELRHRVILLEETNIRHKQFEEGLKKRRQQHRAFFEPMTARICHIDLEGRIVRVTKTAAHTMGLSVKDIAGKTLYDILPPDDASKLSADNEKIMKSGKPKVRVIEEYTLLSTGKKVWIECDKIPYYGTKGDVAGLIIYFTDITERKKEEEALRSSQLQLYEAMDLARIVYWEVDPADGAFIFNDPFYAFYGTTAEQEGGYRMTGEEYSKRFVYPEDQSCVFQFAKQNTERLCPESASDIEHRIIRRDGEVRHILVRARIVKDGSGRIVKRYGANQDITDRKDAERQLRMKSRSLEEVNTALKVLLEQREKDKNEQEDKILFNVRKLILPYVDSLRQKRLDDEQTTYLDILEANLKNIISPFVKKLTSIHENFTPLEIKVADFIRDGKTAKEIAKTFGVSESAINLHRQHIRNKLGLNNKKINLTTYLLSLTS